MNAAPLALTPKRAAQNAECCSGAALSARSFFVAALTLRTAKRLQKPFRGLQTRLVIDDEPEAPLDQGGVVFVYRLSAVQKCHGILL